MAKIFLLAGTTSWTVPSDWNNSANTIEAIGEGGNGQPVSGGNYGYAGGGGAYSAIGNLTLTVGASIAVRIGSGGQGVTTQFKDGSTLVADYGRSGSAGGRGVGGATANCVGTTKYAGGMSGDSYVAAGAGGGGAGGPSGPGGAGGTSGAGYAGHAGGGGGGANNRSAGSDSSFHSTYGDGGAGGGSGGGAGGVG